MHSIPVSAQIWVAAILIVMPIPEAWIKVAIAVLMLILVVVFGL
jgi:hypothetical protein